MFLPWEPHELNGHGFGWTPGVGDGQGGLVCCGSWGCKESDVTEQLNWSYLLIVRPADIFGPYFIESLSVFSVGSHLFLKCSPLFCLCTLSSHLFHCLREPFYTHCSLSSLRFYPWLLCIFNYYLYSVKTFWLLRLFLALKIQIHRVICLIGIPIWISRRYLSCSACPRKFGLHALKPFLLYFLLGKNRHFCPPCNQS